MSTEAYISSGVLEAYELDQLPAQERAEVEQMMAQHPEVKQELEAIERTLEELAFATITPPPTKVEESFMQAIQKKEAPVVALDPASTSGIWKFAVAASVTVALVSVVMAFTYWKKWQGAEEQLTDLITQNAQFAENYNQVNQQLENIEDAVAILNDTRYTRVSLAGTDNAPDAQATVYWNEASSAVYLSVQTLKTLSQDQQYQLWAIIDGQPVDAGVFDPTSGKLLLAMKTIQSGAAAFAITIEPRGGSEVPSLETMQVVGNV